jgi:hypothetical protein
MNRQLAEAVIAAFGDEDAQTVRERLARFDERDWMRTAKWLHTSGLALYFLARATKLGVEDAMPSRMVHELAVNLAENRARNADLFSEFVRINMELQRAKLSYANLKGFALVPHACADPAYRYQHDLDLLVSRRDAERCHEALGRHGYWLVRVSGDTWEFRAGPSVMYAMRDLYKAKAQRTLEMHLMPEAEEGQGRDRLSRMQLQTWNGFEFPALSECDKLLAQAMHLFKHFQSEWTRTAWMLEYATAIRSHAGDETFWREVVTAIEAAPEMKTGIGMASLIAGRAFAVPLPACLAACTVDAMPARVRLWADHYEQELVLIEHPGSKLYLLLQDVLLLERPEWRSQRRQRLLPLRLPQTVAVAARNDDVRTRWKSALMQVKFIGHRLRFHVTAGLRYKIEAARWKRFVAGLQVM